MTQDRKFKSFQWCTWVVIVFTAFGILDGAQFVILLPTLLTVFFGANVIDKFAGGKDVKDGSQKAD